MNIYSKLNIIIFLLDLRKVRKAFEREGIFIIKQNYNDYESIYKIFFKPAKCSNASWSNTLQTFRPKENYEILWNVIIFFLPSNLKKQKSNNHPLHPPHTRFIYLKRSDCFVEIFAFQVRNWTALDFLLNKFERKHVLTNLHMYMIFKRKK